MSTPAIVESKAELQKIELRRVIRASRQRVFAAWTRPEELRRWFGPGGIHVAEADLDLRVGGAYRIVMQGSMENKPEEAERRMPVVGEYSVIVPDETISFTWRPEWENQAESLVTVRLRDVEGGTEVHLTHERIISESSCSGYDRGWKSCMDKLANRFDG
ncbi:MAG: SRPBCC domain-containing protein [Acidobacteriota bacterium]